MATLRTALEMIKTKSRTDLKCTKIHFRTVLFFVINFPIISNYYAFLAISAISVKAFGSVTAISASIFLFIVTLAFFNPAIILL